MDESQENTSTEKGAWDTPGISLDDLPVIGHAGRNGEIIPVADKAETKPEVKDEIKPELETKPETKVEKTAEVKKSGVPPYFVSVLELIFICCLGIQSKCKYPFAVICSRAESFFAADLFYEISLNLRFCHPQFIFDIKKLR